MPEPLKISVVTLGCPKNVVDSEYLLGQLQQSQARLVANVDDADTLIINTCGFIKDAKQESIDAIMEAVEKKKRGGLKKIVVMGCLAERFKKELAAEIPEVDSFFGTNQLSAILKDLGTDYKTELLGERSLTTPDHYAYLKISEGCDNPCSFCAIPLMRGQHRTKPMEELVHEARLLAEKGVKELIVIGQDTTSYGLDLYGERRLAQLLGKLNGIDGIEWIRLMYAYPAKFPHEVIDAFQKFPKLCRYIDIPIQHCSDRVLKSMRRGMTRRSTYELLTRLQRELPGLALRTTLIVGYPGETNEDFTLLYDFVKEMRFHRLGVFTYSQEEGTAAFDLGDPVAEEVKQERQAAIMEAQKEISRQHNESLVGKTLKVLVDGREGEFFVGRTEWDAPEIDQEVFVRSAQPLKAGTFQTVTITDGAEYDLYASA
ncbi:MAG: 30S ribosomal protein S12 methylthiotransferase RimO [Ignavibacteriae bacterium]|nr:MAG: 30S ribosomal protein S12 methylthiotransferase RimO [Ignavibacteriota bacterium]